MQISNRVKSINGKTPNGIKFTFVSITIFIGFGFAFFVSAFGAPNVTTNNATNVTNTTAVLNGAVNPNDVTSTASFEYWTDNSTFADKAMTGTPQNFGGNTSSQYSFSLFNLRSNTTYYFRAAAQNYTTGYFWTYGEVRSFTTGSQTGLSGAPAVTTETPINLFQNSATLRASVNPNNDLTTVWFEYGTSQSLGSVVGNQSTGSGQGSQQISYTVNGLQTNTTYYYRASASNSRGITHGNILSFVAGGASGGGGAQGLPSVTTDPISNVSQNFVTLNGTVQSTGGYSTEAWFEYGPTQSLGSFTPTEFIGFGSRTFSRTVNNFTPNTTYFVQAVARNQSGTVRGSIVTFFTSNQAGVPYYGTPSYGNAPNVTTQSATFVSSRTALINGTINPNNESASVWFEWGASLVLGNATDRVSVGNSNSVLTTSFVLSGLTPNTTYYYRAVGENSRGIQRGEMLSFRTGIVAVTSFPANPPAAGGTVRGVATGPASIVLTPSVDNNNPKPGDTIRFSVLYKNAGTGIARNAVLKVIYPTEFEFLGADSSPRNEYPSYLAFVLGDIDPSGAGSVTITFRLKNSVAPGTALVINMIADYDNGILISDASSAFFAVTVAAITEENASFFAALFSGISLDWFLLVAGFLLALLFLFYWFVVRKKRDEEEQKYRTA